MQTRELGRAEMIDAGRAIEQNAEKDLRHRFNNESRVFWTRSLHQLVVPCAVVDGQTFLAVRPVRAANLHAHKRAHQSSDRSSRGSLLHRSQCMLSPACYRLGLTGLNRCGLDSSNI